MSTSVPNFSILQQNVPNRKSPRPPFPQSSNPSELLSDSTSSSLTPEHPGILALRPKMWESVSSRSHHVLKIFPFGKVNEAVAEADVMIYGTVDYGFKAGGSERKEWAARAELVREEAGGEWNWAMRIYQVYLVSVVFLCILCDARGLGIWRLMLR